jgi:hypothetical protein
MVKIICAKDKFLLQSLSINFKLIIIDDFFASQVVMCEEFYAPTRSSPDYFKSPEGEGAIGNRQYLNQYFKNEIDTKLQ